MTYTWRCDSCQQHTEVERRMADIDVPPAACHHCGHPTLQRIITTKSHVKGFILEGGGWHNDLYTKNRPIK